MMERRSENFPRRRHQMGSTMRENVGKSEKAEGLTIVSTKAI